jgi:hypothetical protein
VIGAPPVVLSAHDTKIELVVVVPQADGTGAAGGDGMIAPFSISELSESPRMFLALILA